LSEELTSNSKIIVPTKTAHALTRLILLVDLTRIKAYQIVYQTWYIFFILVLTLNFVFTCFRNTWCIT